MLQTKIGLVDTTGRIAPEKMTAAAAALDIQVTRDLPSYWKVSATVSYLPDHRNIPQGVWPVQIVKSLPPGEGGFHLTKHNQPYAKVILTPGSDEWTIDASHEIVEMLVDPNGNRLQPATAIKISGNGVTDDPSSGKFEYLVEACDPCEDNSHAYNINGVMVSDFLTPHFYDAQASADVRYSFTGALTRPRELLKGGYISFVDPRSFEMKQILWVDAGPPQMRSLGPVQGASLRAFVEASTLQHVRDKRKGASKSVLKSREKYRKSLNAAALVRAKHYV